MWGALQRFGRRRRQGRLIPTCVGSTKPHPQTTATYPAHPHVCGEHSLTRSSIRLRFGSSPRVWGARTTYLGCAVALPAHPHVCGEHNNLPVIHIIQRGSSPRVWGARRALENERTLNRLIPTCVGSTHLSCQRLNLKAAHPHVCGEHGGGLRRPMSRIGSSPRVWGARMVRIRLHGRRRLIPTCVGSTTAARRKKHRAAAHPHVCGEHTC